jgi:hypothetical protein
VVEGVGVAGVGERELREIVYVHLRLVCAGAHDPLPIFADAYPATGFLEFKVLQELDSILVLRIILKATLSAPRKPVRERPGC